MLKKVLFCDRIILMESDLLMKLDLRAPLFYVKIEALPEKIAEKDEFLLCYDLNSAQSLNIEPDREQFLGALAFAGRKKCDSDAVQAEIVSLPAGNYLFTQYRSALNSEERLDLAIEQQKDGLWERHKPKNRLFIRYLFEDGSFVTQFFRPIG
jgi:hypothetical protein